MCLQNGTYLYGTACKFVISAERERGKIRQKRKRNDCEAKIREVETLAYVWQLGKSLDEQTVHSSMVSALNLYVNKNTCNHAHICQNVVAAVQCTSSQVKSSRYFHIEHQIRGKLGSL